jgi:hypothetical protein
MTQAQATAEVFLTAFHALPDEERLEVIKRLVKEEELEDLFDSAIAEERRNEPSRPIGEYLAEHPLP